MPLQSTLCRSVHKGLSQVLFFQVSCLLVLMIYYVVPFTSQSVGIESIVVPIGPQLDESYAQDEVLLTRVFV